MSIYLVLGVCIGAVGIFAALLYKAYKSGKAVAELEAKDKTIDNLYIAKKIKENTKADDYDPYE